MEENRVQGGKKFNILATHKLFIKARHQYSTTLIMRGKTIVVGASRSLFPTKEISDSHSLNPSYFMGQSTSIKFQPQVLVAILLRKSPAELAKPLLALVHILPAYPIAKTNLKQVAVYHLKIGSHR